MWKIHLERKWLIIHLCFCLPESLQVLCLNQIFPVHSSSMILKTWIFKSNAQHWSIFRNLRNPTGFWFCKFSFFSYNLFICLFFKFFFICDIYLSINQIQKKSLSGFFNYTVPSQVHFALAIKVHNITFFIYYFF